MAKLKRSIRRSIEKRKLHHEIYQDLRQQFEVEPVYKGWFRWKRLVGWVVNVLIVEGSSCAAPGGSLGYVVDYPLTETLPTKYQAYRWLLSNVRDFEDVDYYTTSKHPNLLIDKFQPLETESR